MKEEETKNILDSFNGYFENSQDNSEKSSEEQEKQEHKEKDEKEKLKEKFANQRNEWNQVINDMSNNMKNVDGLIKLMDSIYSKRQQAVDFYHYLTSLLIRINNQYRRQFAEKYKFYSWESQRRYPNEKTKTNQILSEMEDISTKKEMISSHVKFMEKTIGTLDNIIFGIKNRIEIEQIKRGR